MQAIPALVLLVASYQWHPPCADPGSFGEGLPRYCVSEAPVAVATPHFRAEVPAGVRWGVCRNGSCLEIRAPQAIPAYVIAVHRGPLQGLLAEVDEAASLARQMSGPMRPCQVIALGGQPWVHCRHDFGEHPAAERLEEGDYYRLVGDHWLGVRYTLSRGQAHALWRERLDAFLASLAPRRD